MGKNVQQIRVAELFAGVGGFRLGLEGYGKRKKTHYKVVWSNQWEPSTNIQHASNVYVERFGEDGHSNEDIARVPTANVPDHDLLVGGFPCQDYSVARTLSQATGIQGKKGVLWWQIHRILEEKGTNRPNYLMLENVDRLLKSPVSQRGRDFAIMIASLNDLGYAVEWRVVNAADYGFPQRRRRVFILGYKRGTPTFDKINRDINNWFGVGVMGKSFPVVVKEQGTEFTINGTLDEISKNFNLKAYPSPFFNSGISIARNVTTVKALPNYKGRCTTIKDIIIDESEVPEEYFIKNKDLPKWKYLKGAKKDPRKGKNGFEFFYSEGPVAFPDPLTKPSRTIVTGEGGSGPSRFKHVIEASKGKLRRLTPLELERLCMFPDNHTAGQSDTKRAFFMGNALVVGVIERLGNSLHKEIISGSPRVAAKRSTLSSLAGTPKVRKPSNRVA